MLNKKYHIKRIFSPPNPPKDLESVDSEQALLRYDEISKTVRRVFHILIGTSLFCLIALSVPDSQLILPDAVVSLPILNVNVSFDAFMILGPILIIGLTIYMHLFYGELRYARLAGVQQRTSVYALFNISGNTALVFTWFLFYWMPPIVIAVFAWKASPRPTIGSVLLGITLFVTLVMLILQMRRCVSSIRMWAIPILTTFIVVVLIMLGILVHLMITETTIGRTLNLFKADLAERDLRDIHFGNNAILMEAKFTKADLRRAKLIRANLSASDLTGANLEGAILEGADFTGSDMKNVNIGKNTVLTGANLQWVTFGSNDDVINIKGTGANNYYFSTLAIDKIKGADNWALSFYNPNQLEQLGLKANHNESLRKRDLNNIRLRGVSFKNADLSNFNLSHAHLNEADLTGANLSGSNLQGADLTNTRLGNTNLSGTNLRGAILKKATIDIASLNKANNWLLAYYESATIEKLGLTENHNERIGKNKDFSEQNLSNVTFRGGELTAFNFSNADLRKANFLDIDLSETNFSGANLEGAVFENVQLRNANLKGSKLNNAKISIDEIRKAHNWILAYYGPKQIQHLGLRERHNLHIKNRDLSQVNLADINMAGSDLSRFNLTEANLQGANLEGADLSEAFLASANLSRANLTGAKLSKTNFNSANLTGSNFSDALLLESTLVGAKLAQTNFSNAQMEATDLRNTAVSCKQLKAANNWEKSYHDATLKCGNFAKSSAPDVSESIRQSAPKNISQTFLAKLEKDIKQTPVYLASRSINKLHLNIGVVGGTAKVRKNLTAAIDKIMSERYGGNFTSIADLKPSVQRKRGITIASVNVKYETAKRRYNHVLFGDHSDFVKGTISNSSAMSGGAIFIVDAIEGITAQLRNQLYLAKQVGISKIVVYLNEDNIDRNSANPRLLEKEIENVLNTYGFTKQTENAVIIHGSSLKALQGENSDIGVSSILKLMETLDKYLPKPARAIDREFLMPVEDVFSISGRGTVVTGRIENGVVKVGDEVELVGIKHTSKVTITGVEMFRKLLDQGQVGDNVGLVLRDIERSAVERGQVLSKPGSIKPYTNFEAQVYILNKEEGGRHTPFFNGYRPQFYIRTTDVTGLVELPNGVEMVMPGDNVHMNVKLTTPIAMQIGLRFAIREGGRTVGIGVISKLHK